MIERIIPFTRSLLTQVLTKDSIVVDGTAGNGHDTLFLAENAKHVYSFDIQQEAILSTEAKLKAAKLRERVTLIHDGHEKFASYVSEAEIDAAIFNLGYLPGSDKSVITLADTTLKAVEDMLAALKRGGLLILVVYYGHDGGKEEKEELLQYVEALPQKQYDVLRYGFINQKNDPPFLLAIGKK
ncbi:class I SAM-dependent methyltransferase [Paenalkalicoccus suaedae]|uniref:Class I SAM-dependent methyltransferase n=1 Tax=Paenalkalicoccus suaedae TaxID=2592382 RepID=A0A859FGA3_9BACI|nr:class I SAM-dependent methyltransferase [Paenalkalicoccus suaedae]QKS72127.1 class I SAM-dependent methyltransferase [Paenalkalicoccus suaedae]